MQTKHGMAEYDEVTCTKLGKPNAQTHNILIDGTESMTMRSMHMAY